jgi:hypothetical protein
MMQYPNVGAPSPQEIYDGLKMIPNTQQGKQMLTNIAQQGKQSGSVEGGIATALLNSYNQADQARQAPPAPQGTVADQVITQAQPPMPQYGANMMGLATPGLEQAGQQQVAQRMATGGIVALAGGGPVQHFSEGSPGGVQLSEDMPTDWGNYGAFNPLPGADPDTGLLPPTMHEMRGARVGRGGTPASDMTDIDLVATRGRGASAQPPSDSGSGFSVMSPDLMHRNYDETLGLDSTPEIPRSMGMDKVLDTSGGPTTPETPAPRRQAMPPAGGQTVTPPAPTTTETRPASPSLDEQINRMQQALGVPPDVAAELISQREHDHAKSQKMNVFENIAAGLAGYLGTYGSGAHRAGAGLAYMLGNMGTQRKEEDKYQSDIDALRRESALLPYTSHHEAALKTLADIASRQSAAAKQQGEERLTTLKGGIDQTIEGMRTASSEKIAAQNNLNSLRTAYISQMNKGQLTADSVASLYGKAVESFSVLHPDASKEEIDAGIKDLLGPYAASLPGGMGASPTQSSYEPLGKGMFLSGSPQR